MYYIVAALEPSAGPKMAWFIGVLIMILLIVVCTTISVKVCRPQEMAMQQFVLHEEPERQTPKEIIADYISILKVKVCRKVMIYNFIFCIGYIIIMNMATYAITYCTGSANTTALVSIYWTVNTIACIVSAPICTAVANKFDKKTSVIFFLILSSLWQAVFYIVGIGSPLSIAIWTGANAFACTAFYGLYQSMLFDTCDAYDLKYGERREGSIISMSMFMQFIGQSVGTFIVGQCLNFIGYDGSDVVSESVSDGILFISTVVPAIFMLGGIAWIFTHKLTRKRFGELQDALERRRNGEEIDLNEFKDII